MSRFLFQKGTSKVNGASARHVIVEPGGAGVVAHVWLHALGSFADRLGPGRSTVVAHRAHAYVEKHIAAPQGLGLLWFPFTNFCANANWMTAVMKAADLVRWFQLLCFDGPWVNTRPKALRCGIFYPPGHPSHSPLETAHRAHHRRLARHRRPPRCATGSWHSSSERR